MSTADAALKRTPFRDLHLEHGARMVEFAGYEMPITYGSIIDEHRWCRASAGFFDVSHMGRLRFSGRHARRFLDHVCTRQIHGMQPGMVRYSLVCNARGGCHDDVLVYCVDEDEYLMVCNASNRHKLLGHFAEARGTFSFRLEDETESTAMVAIQGPKAMELVARLSSTIPSMKRYRFVVKNLVVIKLLVSRTGYTGEDGVEVVLPASMAKLALGMVLKDMKADADAGASIVRPVGLGARDTLRMEAGMPLYGHEISEDLDPVSAGLEFAIRFDKGMTGGPDDERTGTFIGQEALRKIKADGPARRLVGLLVEGRRSPRQGMAVLSGGGAVGEVTSGCLSPTLDRAIAMAYVPTPLAAEGTALEVDFAGKPSAAKVVKLPFVSNV